MADTNEGLPPTRHTGTALLIASSLRHAVDSATIDWGWKKTGPSTFVTPEGELVAYAADSPNGIRGFSRGWRVFLGYGWQDRRDSRVIKDMIDEGRLVAAAP